VFAIPGSIHAALAKGCHDLIREGAKLVDTAHDILSDWPCRRWRAIGATRICSTNSPASAGNLLAVLGHDPVE
jgi:DNA processing protein